MNQLEIPLTDSRHHPEMTLRFHSELNSSTQMRLRRELRSIKSLSKDRTRGSSADEIDPKTIATTMGNRPSRQRKQHFQSMELVIDLLALCLNRQNHEILWIFVLAFCQIIKWIREDSRVVEQFWAVCWTFAVKKKRKRRLHNYHKPIYNSFLSLLPSNHPYHWLIIPFYHLYSESHYHTQIDSCLRLPLNNSRRRCDKDGRGMKINK